MKQTIVAVSGSRNWPQTHTHREYIRAELDRALKPDFSVLHLGDNPNGADAIALDYARIFGRQHGIFQALWDNYGKAAGYHRNAALLAGATELRAFWDGCSPGTADAIEQAVSQGIPVYITAWDGSHHMIPAITNDDHQLDIQAVFVMQDVFIASAKYEPTKYEDNAGKRPYWRQSKSFKELERVGKARTVNRAIGGPYGGE